MMENATSEQELLQKAVERLRSMLPTTWNVAASNRKLTAATGDVIQVEAMIEVTTQQQGMLLFLVEARRSLEPREAEQAFSGSVRRYRALTPYPILVVAPWISARTRELLTQERINYLDLTGNARIEVVNPALFLSHQGADRDPNPASRKARVRGPRSGRLVRFLVDISPPYTVGEIASATRLTAGYISRLLDSLDDEALIGRGRRGQVISTDVQALLRRWTETYDVFKSNRFSSFVAPRGPADLLERIGSSVLSEQTVVTGSFAAVRLAPVAAPALLVTYASEPDEIVQAFGLLPADRGANVVLLRPFDEVVWERTKLDGGVRYAAPSQVAADCLTGDGRMPTEGEALVDWMTQNESAWRAPSLAAAQKDGES